MKKRALFIPMPEYGHIIPTLKLAKKLLSEGWDVDYLVYDEFTSFLLEQGVGVVVEESRRIAPYDNEEWKRPDMGELDDMLYNSVGEVDKYTVILFDVFLSYCALAINKCEDKCVTYITNADCESYKSPPLCYYIETEFVRKLPGLSKLLWMTVWFRSHNYVKLLMYVGFKKMQQNIKQGKIVRTDTIRQIRKKRLAIFPSPFGSIGIDLNTIVLGPRALSQKHLPEERYLGFCLDDVGISSVEGYEDFAKTQEKVTYCSFGSMNFRYPEALKILESIIEAFSGGELGGLILQAGSYYERLARYEGTRIKVVASVNQKRVLSVSDYAITHGGYGTQKECVRYGVPMIVIPLFIDQFHNATTVARLSLGRVVRRRDADVVNITKAMKELMRNDTYKRKLSEIYSKGKDKQEFERAYRFILEGVGMPSEKYEKGIIGEQFIA